MDFRTYTSILSNETVDKYAKIAVSNTHTTVLDSLTYWISRVKRRNSQLRRLWPTSHGQI